MVANPGRGQLNRENIFSLTPFASENFVSRDGFGRPVPCQPVFSPHTLIILNTSRPSGIDHVATTTTRMVGGSGGPDRFFSS